MNESYPASTVCTLYITVFRQITTSSFVKLQKFIRTPPFFLQGQHNDGSILADVPLHPRVQRHLSGRSGTHQEAASIRQLEFTENQKWGGSGFESTVSPGESKNIFNIRPFKKQCIQINKNSYFTRKGYIYHIKKGLAQDFVLLPVESIKKKKIE